MNIAYFDCGSGISGDMTLGALIDAGVPLEKLQSGIDSLGLPSCQLVATEVHKKGFRATQIEVQHEPEHAHRHLHHITDMIDSSQLSPRQKDLAARIFTRLGEAEAKVHGTSIRKVHFHEVGAVDSIADIVGAAIGFDLLGVDRIHCSSIPTGHGQIKIAHGLVSIPAPATAELLKGIPLAASTAGSELTTPTGAAIVATVVDEFGHVPAMTIERIGYGAGQRDLPDRANLLRLLVGRTETEDRRLDQDQVWMLESNIDDISPEILGYCLAKLGEAGALDAFATPIQMKKNRPGVQLAVICAESDSAKLEKILFRETGTLGIRRWPVSRHKLERRPHAVTTSWGEVAGKLALLEDGTTSYSPEYESCRTISEQHDVPLKGVYEAARRAFEAGETPTQ